MNLIEAINSKKPFKRPNDLVYANQLNETSYGLALAINTLEVIRVLTKDDIVATDWMID